MTNKPYGTLYIGVTNDLARRAQEHQDGLVSGFTKKYKLKQLVYFKLYDSIESAITKEKQMKEWQRGWKIEEIQKQNPKWRDMSKDLNSIL